MPSRTAACRFRSSIAARASRPSSTTSCSSRSSRPRRTGSAWASLSRARSSRRMAGGCGARPSRAVAPLSTWRYPAPAVLDLCPINQRTGAGETAWMAGILPRRAPFVAIVDDEDPIRRALERLLRASGLHAQGFATGGDFLAGLGEHRPDCLILDLHMPGMSGLELLRQLQAMEVRLPVVVITAFDDPGSRARCIDAGAAAYLRKPLDQRVLLDAIALAVDGARA